jgi:23S rRNA pseudouridine2605 synthase
MFEKVGHHVEKIKRVRYGPLTLDVPPGKFRELTCGSGSLAHCLQ